MRMKSSSGGRPKAVAVQLSTSNCAATPNAELDSQTSTRTTKTPVSMRILLAKPKNRGGVFVSEANVTIGANAMPVSNTNSYRSDMKHVALLPWHDR